MTRRNQKRFSQNQRNQNNYHEKPLIKMLDLRKLNYFRYDAKEIFNSTNLDQKVWNPLLVSIVTKASRLSIKEAKDYIDRIAEEGVINQDTTKELIHLLEKYKRWR